MAVDLPLLPDGWIWGTLADLICEGPTNGYSGAVGESGSPTLKLSATTQGRMVINEETTKRLAEIVPPGSSCFLSPGDLLVQRSNTLDYLGAAAIYDGPGDTWVYPDLMMRIRVADERTRNYLWRWLNSLPCRAYFRARATGTAGNMPKINGRTLVETPVPIPPINEQARIAARIEAFQARSRKAREALGAIPALLEQYRQSVLASAFRGDLTANWREQHPDVEPASVLLGRIRRERRRQWEAENPRKKYVEPEPVDDSDLPELPEGWCWTAIEEVTENHDGRRIPVKESDRKTRRGEYPYYGASGIIDSVDSYLFEGSYLLVAEDGANLLSRSTPIAFPANGRFWVNNHAHVIQPLGGVHIAYLVAYLNGFNLRPFVTGSAQPKLTQAALNRVPVGLAPLQEQGRVVERVHAALAFAERIDGELTSSFSELSLLDQSILAKAFRGELVEQDPADEPASALLERIRAERTSNNGSVRKAKRSRT